VPALYFDPLIVIAAIARCRIPEPNYCTRCDEHHHLPGKEYAFLFLKPAGESASKGDVGPLRDELAA